MLCDCFFRLISKDRCGGDNVKEVYHFHLQGDSCRFCPLTLGSYQEQLALDEMWKIPSLISEMLSANQSAISPRQTVSVHLK